MTDARPLAAPRPCAECPWRIDAPPGKWPAERYEVLAKTIGAPGAQAPLGTALFACHMTREGRETACAGWLARHGRDHLTVRLYITLGHISPATLDPAPGWPELYPTYADLLDAQGPQYADVPRQAPTTERNRNP